MTHDHTSNTPSEWESENISSNNIVDVVFEFKQYKPKKSTITLHMWYLSVLISVPFKQKAGLFERNNVHTIIVKVHTKATGIEVIV